MQIRSTKQQSWPRFALLLGLLGATFCSAAEAQEAPLYRDAHAPVEQRVADLLSRMTLEEKVAQLEGTWQNTAFATDASKRIVDDKGAFVPEHAAVLLKYGLGEMSRPSEKRGPHLLWIPAGTLDHAHTGEPSIVLTWCPWCLGVLPDSSCHCCATMPIRISVNQLGFEV